MPDFLELTVDKFTFKVATDRYYSSEGIWALASGKSVRIGLSDFLQQRSGDVAFVEVKPVGTRLAVNDEMAAIETIKVNIALSCPLAGTILRINPLIESTPEIINQDPYGAGWVCELQPDDWQSDSAMLQPAEKYFEQVKREAEEENQR
jgi:glycine cleavage system H protein